MAAFEGAKSTQRFEAHAVFGLRKLQIAA